MIQVAPPPIAAVATKPMAMPGPAFEIRDRVGYSPTLTNAEKPLGNGPRDNSRIDGFVAETTFDQMLKPGDAAARLGGTSQFAIAKQPRDPLPDITANLRAQIRARNAAIVPPFYVSWWKALVG